MTVVLNLWMTVVGLSAAMTTGCETGWFGPLCQYKCRCTPQCQTDGSCRPGSLCQTGWFGPACQYVDLAPSANVKVSGHVTSVVTDHDVDTCNMDINARSLTLVWNQSYLITWLRLHAKNIGFLQSLTVAFSSDTGTTTFNVTCIKSVTIADQNLDIFCEEKKPVNYVIFTGEGVSSLCSVHISGGRNVALHQKTSQSGIWVHENRKYGSEKAVDGNTNGDFNGHSCTATQGTSNPKWTVTLTHPAKIARFVLYNRQDGFHGEPARLKGFKLTGYDAQNGHVCRYKDSLTTVQNVYTLTPQTPVFPVSVVRIEGAMEVLTLCEVEMFGETECEAGRYGRDCEHKCNCADTRQPCLVSTGGCPSGCAAGYGGESCAPCEPGWFGSDCKFKCQCRDNTCSPVDGQCSSCTPGWFGPACQYVDLVSGSSLYPPTVSRIADSDDTTCFSDVNITSITVTWKSVYLLTWLRVHVQNPDFLNSFTVSLTSEAYRPVTCGNLREAVVTDRILDIHCDILEPVKSVTISGAGIRFLCSLYISGGRNVALRQQTSQSRTYHDATDYYRSSKAVDGNISGNFENDKSCTAAIGRMYPNWTLIFLRPVKIVRYILYNRQDGNYGEPRRLKGFQIISLDVNNKEVYKYTDTLSTVEHVYTLNLTSPVFAVSSIQVQVTNEVLTLCEVEVYGDTDCDAGRYGRECEHTCNCADQREPCFVSTGGCPSGCAAGYMGDACTQSCDGGKYGHRCQFDCSSFCILSNIDNKTCDHVNGTCLNGCHPGYTGIKCDSVCPNGTYGRDCNLNCSENCVPDTNGAPVCHHINGTCLYGCVSGFMSSLCNTTCLPGQYGQECNLNCSEFCESAILDNRTCDHVTGDCLRGCQPGYIGEKCTFVCPMGSFGKDCKSSCPDTCMSDGNDSLICDHITGICHNGCLDGHISEFCNETCPAETFGEDCAFSCSKFCVSDDNNVTSCHHVNGTCLHGCLAGYGGPNCSETCPEDKYGKDCSSDCSQFCTSDNSSMTTCHHVNGSCLHGCHVGYHTPSCNESCQPGTYGEHCSFNCSQFCNMSHLACDNVNGRCLYGCRSGYTGNLCKEACQPGTYGEHCSFNCSQFCNMSHLACDNVNGTCLRGCRSGYTGSLCEEACEPGTYGEHCSFNCSQFCNMSHLACDNVNGTCLYGCRSGYTGNLCEEACEPGTYGEHCSLNCSQFCNMSPLACDNVNGTCLYGCRSGYTGSLCEEEILESSLSNLLLIGIAVGVIVVVIIFIVSGAVIHWQCRRKRAQEKCRHQRSGSYVSILDTAFSGTELSELDTKASKPDVYHNRLSKSSFASTPLNDLDIFMTTYSKDFFQEHFNIFYASIEPTVNVRQSQYKHMNEYIDIHPVYLTPCDKNYHDDYTSEAKVYGEKEEIIAFQGPTENTLKDFVHLLWEQGTEKVVMVTDMTDQGEVCEKYWPEEGVMKVGGVTIRLANTKVFAGYTIRRLQLKKKGEPVHSVDHFHFTTWPDLDVHSSFWSLVDFELRVASYPTSKPIIVHYSKNVYHTGVFISLWKAMRQAEDIDHFDVLSVVQKLRYGRIHAGKTSYHFLHKAAFAAKLCREAIMTTDNIGNKMAFLKGVSDSSQTNLEKEFMAVCYLSSTDDDDQNERDSSGDVVDVYENIQMGFHKQRNQGCSSFSKSSSRPVLQLKRKKVVEYEHAAFVPSIRKENHHFLVQAQLPAAVTDFWRLVTQYNVSLIVECEDDLSIQDLILGNHQSCCKKNSDFEVKSQKVATDEICEQRTVTITKKNKKNCNRSSEQLYANRGHILTYLKCMATDLEPDKMLALATKIKSLNSNRENRTVYMCSNGFNCSSLAYVLCLLLDKLDIDGYLTVPLIVGSVKAIRPQAIPTLAEYELLYQVLNLYKESSHVYATIGSPLEKPLARE